ncbi:hypothetical protein N8653_00995 [Euryarchaeota archaeon]|nr:hypothetical protein [Euryarchaeota archaeon]
MGRLGVKGVILIIIFTIPTVSPVMATEWKSDGWIKNLIGPERLVLGDEFGCHGFENIDINDEQWIIESCKEYLSSQSNSSRWGKYPISFGITSGEIDNLTESNLLNAGFKIIGDQVTNTPNELFVMEVNGGSLEKNVANISLLNSANKDTLVSIYWIARIYDIKVREDKEVVEWLESNEKIWYTTWGEWYNHKISSQSINISKENNELTVTLSVTNNSWQVPGSISIENTPELVSIKDSNYVDVPILNETDQNLKPGWRNTDNKILLTISPGKSYTLIFENSNLNSTISNPLITFNDLHNGVTVVGHHVSNLRESASDFLNSEILFTWLIERSSEPDFNWPIIGIAIITLIATPIAIKWLILKDKYDTTLG